ncbi:hypothetical protein FQN54_006175 [Arachnomyces sp. PD_36]|nr:hypothetical protein FQN54_006175 [Arachnomyces sp. PD_36]
MAIWPFRRKGKRSRSRAGDHTTGATVDAAPQPETTSSQGQDPGPPPETSHFEHDDSPGKSQRKIVKRRKQDLEQNPRSLSRQSQNNSNNNNTRANPNHHRSSPPPRSQVSPPPASSNPIQIPSSNDPFVSDNNNGSDSFVPYNFQNHTSYSSLGHENYSSSYPPPTLHTKPSVSRRKSAKRKADEYAREREIKAMGGPIRFQKRPATFTQGQQQRWEASGGPSVLSKHASNRPQSDTSLPNHDSLESSLSDASDSYAFKVNAFDALTPRPVIRYAESPRYMLSRSQDPSRASNRKDKRPTIPEEDSRRRMDELADDLDAGALRELMERDQRRREQKRIADHEKLQRRLQRRADRQREEERRRARKEEQGKENTKPESQEDKQVPVGGGDGACAAKAYASKSRDGSSSFLPDASKENLPTEHDHFSTGETSAKLREVQNQRHSVAVSKDVARNPAGGSPAVSVMDYRAGSTSTPHLQQPRGSASDVSRTLEAEKPVGNSVKPMSSWTSFFRRGGSSLRKSSVDRSRKGPPSEFSNTSRESFTKSQPSSVPPPPIPERSFLRTGSSVNRTQSKFTEHLHDYPMSPPDSRLQSPEVPDNKHASPSNRMDSDYNTTTAPVPVPKRNEDRNRTYEANTPETGPGSMFLSQSLASVDSEGSWLSGKPLRRTSHPLNQPMRSSAPSSKDRLDEYTEERKQKETDAYSKMTPDPEGEDSTHIRNTSTGQNTTDSDRESDIIPMHMPQEQEHERGTFHQTVAAKNPILVRPGGARPKSKEGLLNQFEPSKAEFANSEEGESPTEGEVDPEIHRATSVDLGKRHVRHISAGSAKLLDIPRRDSVDSKGQSASVAPASVDTATETDTK